MEIIFYIFLFLISCVFLYISGELIVSGLLKIARFFGVTEFVVAFFVMAVAASLPNLFVGIFSAIKGIPELSFGDIMGNNMIAMTVAVSLAILFSPKKEIQADGETIQNTTIFTILAAILPLILISDGTLSRGEGLILIGFFFYYIFWLFSKKERFSKIYEEDEIKTIEKNTGWIFGNFIKIFFGIVLLILSAQGIIFAAEFIAIGLGLPLVLIGILILGFGSALPEVYFAATSAKKGETSMILGNLMGAVIIPSSLVLGIVALIQPIKSESFEFFAISRIYLIFAAIFFFLFAKSHSKITRKESVFLMLIYISFLITLIVFK